MRFAASSVLFFLIALTCAAPTTADVVVSTLAGSGVTGFADGPSSEASFMLPMGVAYAPNGDLYVADGAAQRIRVVRKDGTVRTVAGSGVPDQSGTWVPGGYADGPAARARFNRPADVAVADDGRVFVADSYNHCIRVISPNGIVSTYAGSPTRSTQTAGPPSVASFLIPTAVALDKQGNLYVIDAGVLRKVDPTGTVSNIPLPGGTSPIGGLGMAETAAGMAFFIPTIDGMYVRLADGQSKKYIASLYTTQCIGTTTMGWWDCSGTAQVLREHRDVGMPWGAVALNDHAIVYSDWKTGSIRLLDARYDTQRLLAGYPGDDESGRAGGHTDGPGSTASFNVPLGLALGPQGQVAIADAGSRRIRVMRGVEEAQPLSATGLSASPASAKRTILYAGDLTSWQGTAWDDSIQGRLQKTVGVNAQVDPLVLDDMWNDIGTLASTTTHRFDVLVLQLNMRDVAALAGITTDQALLAPQLWRPKLAAALDRLKGAVTGSGGKLALVLAPLPNDVGTSTMIWARALDTSFATTNGTEVLLGAVKDIGIPVVDSTPLFIQAGTNPSPPPLFATGESEFAAGGRAAMAQATQSVLNELQP